MKFGIKKTLLSFMGATVLTGVLAASSFAASRISLIIDDGSVVDPKGNQQITHVTEKDGANLATFKDGQGRTRIHSLKQGPNGTYTTADGAFTIKKDGRGRQTVVPSPKGP